MSRADILGCEFVTKAVPLPGGKSATVRELSAGERGLFFGVTKEKKLAEVQAWLVRWGTIGADGSEVFTDTDVPDLVKRPARVLQALSEEVLKLSGLVEDESKKE